VPRRSGVQTLTHVLGEIALYASLIVVVALIFLAATST
jgi:hypothetical protein